MRYGPALFPVTAAKNRHFIEEYASFPNIVIFLTLKAVNRLGNTVALHHSRYLKFPRSGGIRAYKSMTILLMQLVEQPSLRNISGDVIIKPCIYH